MPVTPNKNKGRTSKIFISYRRSDTQDAVGRVYDRLCENFGRHCVFKDIDSIPIGEDFVQCVKHAISESRCALVFIGKDWTTCTNAAGDTRIDDERDPVRVEIELALRAGCKVIPVLVDDTEMPGEKILPEAIREFARLNAARVRTGQDFEVDICRLFNAIDDKKRIIENVNVSKGKIALVCGFLVFAIGLYWMRLHETTEDRVGGREATEVTVDPLVYSPVREPDSSTTEAPVRNVANSLGDVLFVDAIVGPMSRGWFLDVRLANRTDDPHLISSITFTALAVEARPEGFLESDPFGMSGTGVVYDADLSKLQKPGDSVTKVLSQAISPKGTDRFVVRVFATPDLPDDYWQLDMNLNVAIETSGGTILIKNLEVGFYSPSYTSRTVRDNYIIELHRLADRRYPWYEQNPSDQGDEPPRSSAINSEEYGGENSASIEHTFGNSVVESQEDNAFGGHDVDPFALPEDGDEETTGQENVSAATRRSAE